MEELYMNELIKEITDLRDGYQKGLQKKELYFENVVTIGDLFLEDVFNTFKMKI